jgi:flagellar motor protein MotB
MLRLPVLLAFLLFYCCLAAQQSDLRVTPVAIRNLEKTRDALSKYDFETAKKLAVKLVKEYPNWPEGWLTFAQVYQEAGEFEISQNALERLVLLDSTGYPEAYRWIADRQFNKGDYYRADKNFNKYLEIRSITSKLTFKEDLLRLNIRFSIDQIEGQPLIPVKMAGSVNTFDHEYFPSLSVDGSTLAFTRQFLVKSENGKMIPREDLYFAKEESGFYGNVQPFPSTINTDGNEGTQSLRQDGRVMFYTACNRPDTKGGCDIYYCLKTGEHWSVPNNLGYPVNSRYWESTPFLSADGKRLYFSSNRPGGYGGMDLWLSQLQSDQRWSAPVNLGPEINSPLDEMSPMLHLDGTTLFFASNGHVGMGGFDLFKFNLAAAGGERVPENLGYAINTYHDEDGITINAVSNFGLFASTRDSLTGKDIYQIDFEQFIPARSSVTISGTVTDRISGHPVGARVEVQPHGDTLTSSVEADPLTGTFLLGIPERPAYRIGASKSGYLPFSHFYICDTTKSIQRISYHVFLDPVKLGASIVLENVFFSLDSYQLGTESNQDLLEILSIFSQNPGIVMEISGFTDDTGSDDYNSELSQKRAESVVNYLINNGVSPDQLIAKGFGKENPIASNETEEGRRLNRRTEMKVIRLK